MSSENYLYAVETCNRHAKRMQWAKDTLQLHVPFSGANVTALSNLDHAALLKLASTEGIKIRNAATIIEHLADGIAEYLAQSNEVNLVSGLKESILANLRNCAVKHPIKPVFRHSKKRKFDNN
jgi:hypothetical protein